MSKLLRELVGSETNDIFTSFDSIYDVNDYLILEEEFHYYKEMDTAMESIAAVQDALHKLSTADDIKHGSFLESNINILLSSIGQEGLPVVADRVGPESKQQTVLVRMWEGIKRALRAISDKLRDLYRAIFDNVTKIKDSTISALKVVSTLKRDDVTASKKEFDVNANALISKDQDINDLTSNLENFLTELSVFVYDKVVINEVEKNINKASNRSGSMSDMMEIGKDAINFPDGYLNLSKTKGDNKIPRSMEINDKSVKITKHALLPGNKALFTYRDKSSLTGNKYKIGPYKDNNNRSGRVTIDIFDLDTIENGLNYIIKTINLVEDYQGRRKEIDAVKKHIIATGEDFITRMKNEGHARSSQVDAMTYLAIFRWYSQILEIPTNYLNSLAVTVCRGWLMMLTDAIKVYK